MQYSVKVVWAAVNSCANGDRKRKRSIVNSMIADADDMKDKVDVYAVHSCGIFSEWSQFHVCINISALFSS